MAVRKIAHPSDDRKAKGLEARDRTPLSSHTEWKPAADRPDPVALLQEQDKTREQDLVPVRHGRMMVSPFTFYRGAAVVMAADLAPTPVAGLGVQLCGDAHLSNFGLFASPERLLLFDVNDFDETLPGPFEYDVKRMAASFTVAGRNNGFAKADIEAATLASVRAYREAMDGFAQMGQMDIWYSHLDEDELMGTIRRAVADTKQEAKEAKKAKAKKAEKKDEADEKLAKKAEKRAGKIAAKAHRHDSLQALSKLGEQVNGSYRIVSQPPIVVPLRALASTYGWSAAESEKVIRDQFRSYRETHPTWVVPVVLLGLLAALIIGDPGRIDRQKPWLRVTTSAVIALMTLANLAAAGRLVGAIITVNKVFANDALALLATGGVIWATNVIAFGLWYWDLDRGGAAARAHHPQADPAFVFPEMQHSTPATRQPAGYRRSPITCRCRFGPRPRSAPLTCRRSSGGPS